MFTNVLTFVSLAMILSQPFRVPGADP